MSPIAPSDYLLADSRVARGAQDQQRHLNLVQPRWQLGEIVSLRRLPLGGD
jgi:hypothetical protein